MMSSVEVLKKRNMSSSNSPCAACKCLRRKCTQDCAFAPYFPPDNPQKFTNVHKVFGASNVAKLLSELHASQREDAVNSLAYEAEYRLQDPVYGCVGFISVLQHKLKQLQHDLENAKKELATYIGPSAMLPILNHPGFMQQHSNYGPSAYRVMPYNTQPASGLPTGVAPGAQLVIREPQQHQQEQFLESQQLAAAAAREHEMLRTYEQQQQQQHYDLVRFNSGIDDTSGPVAATGFNQMPDAALQPSLALGSSYETLPYHHIPQHANLKEHSHFQHPHQLQLQPHELLLQQHTVTAPHQQQQTKQQLVQPQGSHSQQEPLRAKSEEGRSIGP